MTVKDIVNVAPCFIQVSGIKEGKRYYTGNSYNIKDSVPPDQPRIPWWLNSEVVAMACAQREEVSSFRITYFPVLNIFINDKEFGG